MKSSRNIITLCKWMSSQCFSTDSIRTIRQWVLALSSHQKNLILAMKKSYTILS